MAAYAIVRAFGRSHATALTISASLAQIGEFSFILAGLGVSLALMPERGRDLILAGAIISIILNPFLFVLLDRILAKPDAAKRRVGAGGRSRRAARADAADGADRPYRAGRPRPGRRLHQRSDAQSGAPMLVIDSDESRASRRRGNRAWRRSKATPPIPRSIAAANLPAARCLLVAIPDAFEGGQVVDQARKLNPGLPIVARAHSEAEIEHLRKHGATAVVMSEHETAKAMIAGIPKRNAVDARAASILRADSDFSLRSAVASLSSDVTQGARWLRSIQSASTILFGAVLVLAGIMSSLVALRFGAPLLLVFLVLGRAGRRSRHRRREIRRRADRLYGRLAWRSA